MVVVQAIAEALKEALVEEKAETVEMDEEMDLMVQGLGTTGLAMQGEAA